MQKTLYYIVGIFLTTDASDALMVVTKTLEHPPSNVIYRIQIQRIVQEI